MSARNIIDRRKFLRRFILGSGSASSIPGIAPGQEADVVDEASQLAVTMGYRHNARTVKTEKFPQRSGAQGTTQYCFNCTLYQGGQDDAWASCSFFQNQLVAGIGWCNAWVAGD